MSDCAGMTTDELYAIEARAKAALTYEGEEKDGWFVCPLCGSENVEGRLYDAKEEVAATVVAFGIGSGLKLAREWVEKAPADMLALVAEVRRLRAEGLSVWHDGEDWVVAKSPEDATEICAVTFGSYEGDGEWRKLPDDKCLSVIQEDGQKQELTCKQWVLRSGRGHLCSANY